jgi:phosphatidylinositol-3-phosphatase
LLKSTSSLASALRLLAPLGLAAALSCSGNGGTVSDIPAGGTTPAGTPAPGTPTDPPVSATPKLDGLSAGSSVAGQVSLAAAVPAGTSKVDFQVDGATFATAAAAPFVATWDSFSVANGAHTLAVSATDSSGTTTAGNPIQVGVDNHIGHVFVIVLENHDWSQIKGNASAPYINGTLLAQGAHAENYQNVPGLHPSLPNYIWLEAGSNLGVWDDAAPSQHQLTTTQHLTALLGNAGVSWKSYQEDISGNDCPVDYVNLYAPRHNPAVYFTDITGGLDRSNANCIAHMRPYSELARDLETDNVPAYSFITPNTCDDMHDSAGCASPNSVANGDAWLAREVPKILASKAYKNGGALFITWDESEGGNVPIGFIALSPLAKAGYSNTVRYTHSSTLRSIQTIFGVSPFLGDAANATDLSDLFRSFP